jgi:hypothetical protein
LTWLLCESNKLTYLPTLPNTLENLYCEKNQLVTLPSIPNSLKKLLASKNCFVNTPINPNPSTLTTFIVGPNRIDCIGTPTNDIVTVSEFTLYPNPTEDILHISSNTTTYTWKVYDLLGNPLLQGTSTDSEETISVADLPSGAYLLIMNNNETSQSYKFYKK